MEHVQVPLNKRKALKQKIALVSVYYKKEEKLVNKKVATDTKRWAAKWSVPKDTGEDFKNLEN